MYKISDEVINIIEKTMKTWIVELTLRGRSLAEAKVQRGIFQGDAQSPLLFIIAMISLNYILRKCTAGYKLSRSQEKITHLMQVHDIKQNCKKKKKKKKELETRIHAVRIYSRDIEMEFGIEKCAMLVMKSGKRHITDGMVLPNQADHLISARRPYLIIIKKKKKKKKKKREFAKLWTLLSRLITE